MEKIDAVFKKETKWKTLFTSILMMAIGYGLHKGIVDNYLAEIVGMGEMDRGVTEFFRELPGFMLIFILALFYKFSAEKVQERIKHVPQGGNWQFVPEELWPNNRKNRHSSAYKRLDPKTQSCTIDTGNAHSNYFHPLYNRIPTIRESARLQSFPDEFEFQGPRGSKYRQIGNAVPPLLAKAIAEEIQKIRQIINQFF